MFTIKRLCHEILNFVKAIKLIITIWRCDCVLIVVPKFLVVLFNFDLFAFFYELIPSRASPRSPEAAILSLKKRWLKVACHSEIMKSSRQYFPASFEGKTIQKTTNERQGKLLQNLKVNSRKQTKSFTVHLKITTV
jgi:hypothetical protein